MKIKKQNLEVLFNLTKGTEGLLTLAESRLRDAFVKPLTEQTKEYLNQKEDIYKHFCLKNEEGFPALLEGNKYEFPREKLDEINAELETLGEEQVEVNTIDTAQIKAILERSEYKPKLLEAEIIDNIINSL